MKKVGIIRCRQTEDLCPSTACLKAASTGKLAFEEIGPCEVVGVVSCGGCPGKQAIPRARMLASRGAEVIALASCLFKGTPIGFPCPHADVIKEAIRRAIGESVVLLEYTH